MAFRSMKNYQESPKKLSDEYGLFLIRRTNNFNAGFLDSIRNRMHAEKTTISLERLFKGHRVALAISGPKKILNGFVDQLGLLELEDYSIGLELKDIAVWEVGTKPGKKLSVESLSNIFQNMTELGEQDQFFWQVILLANKDEKKQFFKTQIRAAVYSRDPEQRKKLTSLLQDLSAPGLIKIPRPFSNEQLIDFFKARNLHADTKGPVLNAAGVMSLLKI